MVYTELEEIAERTRRQTIEMVRKAGDGHLGGSLSALEILVALYHGGILHVDPKNPKWTDRDRFILSKAHACQSLYVVLANLGFFPAEELNTFMQNGSRLSGHSDYRIPGVEVAGGSLGHGLGLACGMAWAAKMDGKRHKVYCLIGDGESQEGSIWEAAMFASHHKLNNLIAITDRNLLGSEDFTENTCDLGPLFDKWRCFGWETRSVENGHNFNSIMRQFYPNAMPLMIIAYTQKGHGTSLEGQPKSHHHIPDEVVNA